jgi:hypothetical protein
MNDESQAPMAEGGAQVRAIHEAKQQPLGVREPLGTHAMPNHASCPVCDVVAATPDPEEAALFGVTMGLAIGKDAIRNTICIPHLSAMFLALKRVCGPERR